ncbi:TolB family protein [Nocardioides sp. Bht2]|uniref:TolB family protein n=1 Tax=Nocardioides sp. Bht2 TaxID=3392297 RepID=UPI0039B6E17C
MQLFSLARALRPRRALVAATTIALVGTTAGAAVAAPQAGAPSESAPARAADPLIPGTLVYLKGWSSNVGLGGWKYQIWTMRSDGTRQRQVTADPDLYPYSAATNVAGNRIAFTVGRDSRLSPAGLYVIGMDGSGRTNVLAGRKQITEAKNPTWSPDGKRLAFVGYDTSIRKDIWVVDANGKNLRRVTNCDCAYANSPKWSPASANTIAWTPTSAGAQTGLALLDVRTGISKTLYDSTNSGALTVLEHTWEPNGGRIAFTGGSFNQTAPRLYAIGSALPPGTPMPLSSQTPAELGLYAPAWSPDGTRVAVSAINSSASATTGQDIWVVDSWYGWGPSTPRLPGAYDEEVTSWARTCTSSCAPGGRWSSITVSQRQESNRLRITGGLMPGRSGAKIGVRVQRLKGKRWTTVRRATTRTSAISTYNVSLKRPAYGTCRVLVTWTGNKAHRKATAQTKKIIC